MVGVGIRVFMISLSFLSIMECFCEKVFQLIFSVCFFKASDHSKIIYE